MKGDEAIRVELTRFVDSGDLPGCVFRVDGPGGLLARGGVGNASVEPGIEPVDLARPYDLASLTKPLVTAPLLVLAEQRGELDLAEPVAARLPELSGSSFAEVTLLELATHTAGLPAWAPLYARETTLEGYLRRIAAMERLPTEGVCYSDPGFILVGAVVERACGDSLARLFRERIANPLGLVRTGLAANERPVPGAVPTERGNGYERELAGKAATGYRFRTDLIVGQVHDGNAFGLGGSAGHAGLFGTCDEIGLLARELLRPDRLELDLRSQARLLKAAPGGYGRTVGWVTAAGSEAARGVLPADSPGHCGFTGTSVWLDLERRRSFVLLANRVHPQVPPGDFQRVRAAFHRVAAGLPDEPVAAEG